MAFSPKYTITEKILDNLTKISAAREIVEQARLIPKWEASLRREAKIKSTHSSTAIEGNRLGIEQIRDLADGKEIIAAPKDRNEVLNYLKALDMVPSFAKKGEISVQSILAIHKAVSKNVMPGNHKWGVFRDKQVFVGKRVFDATGIREEVVYMPPKTEDVPKLVKEFIKWLNLPKTKNINPVLLAGMAHYEIARIHPFIDGNGRTARLLATLVLYMSGFDHRRFFALDDYYDRDRPAYYAALKTGQDDAGDITRWMEYFTTGVAISVIEVKDKIQKLGKSKRSDITAQIELTAKQMKIIELLYSKGRITNRDIQTLFRISAQAVHKDLRKLLNLKIIKSRGAGRSAYYVLA